jgi:hypothetical protein
MHLRISLSSNRVEAFGPGAGKGTYGDSAARSIASTQRRAGPLNW